MLYKLYFFSFATVLSSTKIFVYIDVVVQELVGSTGMSWRAILSVSAVLWLLLNSSLIFNILLLECSIIILLHSRSDKPTRASI